MGGFDSHQNIPIPITPTLGGTGQSAVASGDLLYGSATNAWSRLAGDNTGLKKVLSMTGNVPAWSLTNTFIIIVPTQFAASSTGVDELAHTMKITAGQITTGDCIDVYTLTESTSSVNNKIYKLWANTSATLSGATQIGAFGTVTTGAQSQPFSRVFAVRSATTIIASANGTTVYSSSNSVVTTAPAVITIPTLAADVYIMVSVQRANSGDTAAVDFSRTMLIRNS
jgi:hypothetical protein